MDQHPGDAELASRLGELRERIANASSRGLGQEVTLLCVTKQASDSFVWSLYRAGERHFGENYLQAARRRNWPADSVLHMIGSLQQNKARAASRFFDVIESVDRPGLLAQMDLASHVAPVATSALGSSHTRASSLSPRFLLQLNLTGDETRRGVSPEVAKRWLSLLSEIEAAHLDGLMMVADPALSPEARRPSFAQLFSLACEWRREYSMELPVLSMGMSADFEIAVEEGATEVRLGTALGVERH